MIDVCTSFPRDPFFKQYPLDSKTTLDYDEVLTFVIFAFAPESGIFLDKLTIGIIPWKVAGNDYAEKLENLLKEKIEHIELPCDDSNSVASAVPIDKLLALINTPLDFSIQKRSAVIIRIVGEFWQFSSQMAAISTKHELGDQYHTPRRHWWNGTQVKTVKDQPDLPGHRCISFFTGKPCEKDHFGNDKHVRHGISFNLDLISPLGTIPATFDPDIENKGGND